MNPQPTHLAAMQHIPGRDNRAALLREMAAHIANDGRIFLSNWQFARSDRQRRKIVDWEEAGLSMSDLEENDYLLTWQRNGRGLRYVHLLDSAEVKSLAKAASLAVVDEYYDDGKEGNLNLYSILKPLELE